MQPEAQQAPGHPLLPSGSGLYVLEHPKHLLTDNKETLSSLQDAEAAFLNSPHPLDIMSDPSAYGADGAISRDHDPRSYRKAVNHVLKQSVRCLQRRKRIERWHSEERMAAFEHMHPPPPSPVDTSVRSKRHTTADSVTFLPARRTTSVGACNYLHIKNRKHMNRMSCVN